MTQSNNVKTFNDLSSSRAMQNRHSFLSERTATLNWSLDEISSKMSAELVSKLRQDLANLTSFDSVKITSAEQLEQWGRTNDPRRPFLGTAIMSNLPVICIGASVTDRNRSILEDRGLPKSYPAHTGYAAHRMTWGTVYIKVKHVVDKDGNRSVGDYTLFVVSNQLLDIFYGPLSKEKGRIPSKWPAEWVRSKGNFNSNKKSKGKGKKHNSKTTKPGLSALKIMLNKVNPKWSEPLSKVTLTMLKASEKELAISNASGNKNARYQRILNAIAETGDRDLEKLVPK